MKRFSFSLDTEEIYQLNVKREFKNLLMNTRKNRLSPSE